MAVCKPRRETSEETILVRISIDLLLSKIFLNVEIDDYYKQRVWGFFCFLFFGINSYYIFSHPLTTRPKHRIGVLALLCPFQIIAPSPPTCTSLKPPTLESHVTRLY